MAMSKAERAEYNKAYREANKEKLAEYNKTYNKAYREANKEKIAAQKKAYYEANKEKLAEYNKTHNKTYREANKEKIAAKNKAWYYTNKEKLSDVYVKFMISRQFNLPNELIPDELIELKRATVKLKRALRDS